LGKIIGLIPARGGSTRVHMKNIRELNGDPLISWTINTLKKSNLIDEVYVSTDNKNIKQVSLEYGAKVIDRPEIISNEHSQLEPTIEHTLSKIDNKIDIIGTFQCTTPFRNISEIDEGILKMKKHNYDSLIYTCEFDRFIWNREPKPINYDYNNRIRSQDKEWELIETGDYLTKISSFKKYNNRICGNIGYHISNRMNYFDIDTEFDLKLTNIRAKGFGLHA
jgi:CMP-N,N'-diacetyllegionaminic acid synthase